MYSPLSDTSSIIKYDAQPIDGLAYRSDNRQICSRPRTTTWASQRKANYCRRDAFSRRKLATFRSLYNRQHKVAIRIMRGSERASFTYLEATHCWRSLLNTTSLCQQQRVRSSDCIQSSRSQDIRSNSKTTVQVLSWQRATALTCFDIFDQHCNCWPPRPTQIPKAGFDLAVV